MSHWDLTLNCEPRFGFMLHTQEERGLAHGLEAAAAVLIHCSVTSRQYD